jgi:serine/threonine-protein kinase
MRGGDDAVSRSASARLGTVLLGKYRLDRLLGVGGMAVVYKATHRNEAEFAVKMLHPELSIMDDVRTRFLREGKAANSVKHPGAVRVVDDDVAEDGAAFLVMELLDGVDVNELRERGGGGCMTPQAASVIGYQLLDVLAAAHAKGIVHRDIKPANLFVTRDATVKVLDFGIARARDAVASGTSATGTGMVLGTPAFMPPEQALAKSSEIDGRTDVWATGATLFTLMSGQFVHQAENAPQIIVKAATAPARSLAAVAPAVPPAIVAVVDRALAFEKSARWSTAAAMRDALGGAYAATFGEPISRTPLLALFASQVSAMASTVHPDAAVSQWIGASEAGSRRPRSSALDDETLTAAGVDGTSAALPRRGQHVDGTSAALPRRGQHLDGTSAALPRRGQHLDGTSAGPTVPLEGRPSGGTTAQPVASSPSPSGAPGEQRRRQVRGDAAAWSTLGRHVRGSAAAWSTLGSRAGLIGAAVAGALVIAGGGSVVLLRGHGEGPGVVASSTASAMTTTTTTPTASATTTTTTTPTASATPTANTTTTTAANTTTTANTNVAAMTIASSVATAGTKPPKSMPAAGGLGRPKPNCDPPFHLDAEGNKHFKPECYAQ